MKNKKKAIFAVSIILLVAIALYVVVQGNINQGDAIGPQTAVTEVNRTTLETSVTAQGEVYLLAGEVASINNTLEVSEVLVRQNDVVEAGQPLIAFNTNMLERTRELERLTNQLHDTQLLLRSQQVHLDSLHIGPTNIEIENANLNITRAQQGITDANFALSEIDSTITLHELAIVQIQSNLDDARSTLNNTQILFNAGAATQVQLDNAQRTLETTELELVNAQELLVSLTNQRQQAQLNITAQQDTLHVANIQLQDLKERVYSPQNENAIAQQQIAIERTTLAIQEIQRNINNLNDVEDFLFSPIDGTVTSINVVGGGIATQGSPLVQISNAEAYIIRAFVNERHAGQLNVGQNVIIEGSILGNEVLTGQIQSISTIATTTTIAGITERVVPIEITIEDIDTTLLIPGVTLDITVTTDIRENVIAIPLLSTLVNTDGDSFVFVVNDDNIIEQRFIEVVTHADMYIEVSGLEEGEIIILQPVPTLESGTVISPV